MAREATHVEEMPFKVFNELSPGLESQRQLNQSLKTRAEVIMDSGLGCGVGEGSDKKRNELETPGLENAVEIANGVERERYG
ncbi:hypothetical protein OPT61_g2974 [Boeremia exigua]|uniref:Uncharacterized protein n=1 Tax=Boeremia exigua TaxID=749465 RepID=A0ACC2IJK9_9PLEO|nr:hypothetical protein OPT61_g2974 [Boeremia exigua]